MDCADHAGAVHEVQVPLRRPVAGGDAIAGRVLQDRERGLGDEVGQAVLEARQVDDDYTDVPPGTAVLFDDLLELRNLRMTVRSGGLGPVDQQHLTEKLVSAHSSAIAI